MNETTKAQTFRDVFQNFLKINARSISVKTLLSERNLKRINYKPDYQRNYVWDREKQTFFIESVILGTEIPPLILFKSGVTIEVIDGRQRFETLLLFKENDLTLSIKGLKELQALKNKNFNKLSEEKRSYFLESNIRVFEFEVINPPNLSKEVIERVKKEIFRRYNTGITPLTRDELDNAKYDDDEFSDLFKEYLKDHKDFYFNFNRCLESGNILDSSDIDEGVISKNVDTARRFRILYKFPISTYASSSNRTEIIDLLYEFTSSNSENVDSDLEHFINLSKKVIELYKHFSHDFVLHNRLIYETLLWAFSILQENKSLIDFDKDRLKNFFLKNIDAYSLDNPHYYGNIIKRFEKTAEIISSLSGFSFKEFIRDSSFRSKLDGLRQTEEESEKSIDELSSLRLHKPNPTSTPVDEIRADLKTNKYLLRPSYQRQEKINEYKASSIIESILLGINLPPIFIFRRKNDVKEVVDGQQRLLSIIGFLGDQFKNEDGELVYSKNNNFKLKGLRILTDLENCKFSELDIALQDKILDFVIDQIIIDEEMNESFNPIDLFIRLNYKPYPIKPNSFEMWNSTVDSSIIKKVKEVTASERAWFFLREIEDGKADRMLNEELIISLAFINFRSDYTDVIGFFPRQDRITCRLKDKKGLTNFLIDLDSTAIEMQKFLESINKVSLQIELLKKLLDSNPSKESFNSLLNVKRNIRFTRSLQDFYVIWIVLSAACFETVVNRSYEFKLNLSEILKKLKNTNEVKVDDIYHSQFVKELNEIREKYSNNM